MDDIFFKIPARKQRPLFIIPECGGREEESTNTSTTESVGLDLATLKRLCAELPAMPDPHLLLAGEIATETLWAECMQKAKGNLFLQPYRTRYGFRCGSIYVLRSTLSMDDRVFYEIKNEKLKRGILFAIERRPYENND